MELCSELRDDVKEASVLGEDNVVAEFTDVKDGNVPRCDFLGRLATCDLTSLLVSGCFLSSLLPALMNLNCGFGVEHFDDSSRRSSMLDVSEVLEYAVCFVGC